MSRRSKKRSKKIGNNKFAKEILKVFADTPYRGYNFRQLSRVLGIEDVVSRELVKTILNQLLGSGALIAEKRGRYKLNPELVDIPASSKEVIGKVDMKSTGKAYVISDESEEDIFISANNTNRCLHGDTVKVHIFPKRSGRKTEGEVIEVLSREIKNIVGVLQVSRKFAFLVPDQKNIPVDIYIPPEAVGEAKHGEKAVVRLVEWPEHARNPFGEIVEVLGMPGNHEVEIHSIISAYNFSSSFPHKVMKAADKIENIVSKDEIAKRRDFRKVFTCTIDPIDAKDFDDALSIQRLSNGNWEVGIHIADVSHYVVPEGAIDTEAYERATSVYLVDRTVPMLPEKLSNLVCSLRPDEEKLVFSAVFEMDINGKIFKEWYGKAVIKSDRRYTYEEVQAMIEGAPGENKDLLLTLDTISKALRAKRFSKGSIAFKSQEVKFNLDEDGKPIGVYIKEQKDAHKLVEDFMLLANKKVAEKIGRARGKYVPKPFVYRVHDIPNEEKLNTFARFVGKLGYQFNTGSRKSITDSLNGLFKKISGRGEENMIETIAVRTMAKAEYDIQNIGHYGLGFKYYTHFTSPIRRYPDLLVHRLLACYLNGKEYSNVELLGEQCKHSSLMERKAQEAERESIKYKQVEYMAEKVGQEFWGLISGVSKWGIFVEVDESKSEGLISLRDMTDDYYYLDEENYRIIGQRYGQEYKLGDSIRVVLRGIDLTKKQLDFILAD